MINMETEFQFEFQCKICKELFNGEMSDEHLKKHNHWVEYPQSCHRCGRDTYLIYHDKPVCNQWCSDMN